MICDKYAPAWISKISNRLARGESLRASLRDELEGFYGYLMQSVESGNPAWINPVIAEWVQAADQRAG